MVRNLVDFDEAPLERPHLLLILPVLLTRTDPL